MPRRVTALAVAALAVAGASSASAAPPQANQIDARHEAASLLAAARLPPGARPSRRDPTGELRLLRSPGMSPAVIAPWMVNRHRWWTVRARPTAVWRWVRAHPPAGAMLVAEGASGPASRRDLMFMRPPSHRRFSHRGLVVAVVPHGRRSTALRVDAQVVWQPDTWAAITVPEAADRLLLGDGRVIDDAAEVRALAQLINAFEAPDRGTVYHCPADDGTTLSVAFLQSSTGTTLATGTLSLKGCQWLALDVGGRRLALWASELVERLSG